MDTTDFIQTYVPALSEIPDEDVLRVRGHLETFARTGWPDLDTAPNTPFGDLHLTPLAYLVAGIELGLRRFMSDLDLENPANGIVYNCDFVRRFLGNYGVYARDTLQSSGIVRLTFTSDDEVTLDRRTKFTFGTGTAASEFTLRMPHPGGWVLRPVGEDLASFTNNTNFVDAGGGLFHADVPVVGDLNAEVAADDVPVVTPLPSNVSSMRALAAFDHGAPPDSIAVLADRARQTIYSSSMGSRGSARRFVLKEFPDTIATSVVISGDDEMLRDSVNALGISDGRVDVHVRSSAHNTEETLILTAVYDANADKYLVQLPSNGTILQVNGVVYNGETDLPVDNYTVLSVSADHARATMAAAAYSTLENLWLVVDNILDPITADELIESQETSGQRVTTLEVTVLTDPLIPVIAATLESSDSAPVGIDVLVRGFVPVDFTQFNIHYTKRAGTTVLLDRAITEILEYMQSVGHPLLYSDSKIVDALFYAGATDVSNIEVLAQVRWSAADQFLNASAPDPESDLSGALAVAITPPRLGFDSTRALKPLYTDPLAGQAGETLVAAGPRNLSYYLPSTVLEFTEDYDT